MVDIERISIENFKGHDNIAFQPRDINIITGQNNVGKTSILEAIDLDFNPTNIRDYASNADKLVNAKTNQADILCTYSGSRGQSVLGEFTSEGEEQKLSIRLASEEEKIEFFDTLINRQISDEERVLKDLKDAINYSNGIETLLQDSIDRVISDYVTKDEFDQLFDAAVVLERERSEVPFVYISNNLEEFVADVSTTLCEEIGVNPSDSSEYSNIEWAIERISRGLVIGRHGRSNYLGTIEDSSEVKFVKTLDISEKDIRSHSNYSVILSRIEDDLRDYDLVENLHDFSLNELVFDEDGDRYSIPYDFMGDGFKSMVGLLWELRVSEEQNYALLLEEPENHMHPGYIRDLVGFLTAFTTNEDTQLFITTHNMDFIREFLGHPDKSLKPYLQENFQIVQVRKHASKVLDYGQAKSELEELHLDLRGG